MAGLRKRPVLHAVIRPAFVSGCIWALGFLFMIKGIHQPPGRSRAEAAGRGFGQIKESEDGCS